MAIAGGAAWVLFGSRLLVVRHVQVTGNNLVPAAQVRAVAGIRLGAPLATVNTGAAARRVEQLAPVLSASVRRSWPDTIVIAVRERTAKLAVAGTAGYQLVDGDGVIVRTVSAKPAGMPVLTDAPGVLRGSPAIRAAVTVLGQLPARLRSRIVSVSAPEASAVTLRLTGGITVLWGSAGGAAQKAAELAALLPTHARFYDVSDPGTAATQR